MNTTHTLSGLIEKAELLNPTGAFSLRERAKNKTKDVVAPAANGVRVSRLPYKAKGKSLRRQYRGTLQVGVIMSLLVMLVLFKIPLQVESTFENEVIAQEVVQLEEIIQTEQKIKAPPPPRPIVPIEVPNDEILEEEEFELDVALDLEEIIENLAPPVVPDLNEEDEVDEAEIFMVVEDMPTIIGGREKLYEYVEYPAMAREAGLEGTVVVVIVIDEKGVPQDFNVLKSIHPLLDEASTSALSKIRFTPGRQRGKAVRVKMAIPIRFKLKN